MAKNQNNDDLYSIKIDKLIDKHIKYRDTLEGFKNWSDHLSRQTLYAYIRHIIKFLETVNKPFEALSFDDYIDHSAKLSHRSRLIKYAAIRKFSEYLFIRGIIKANFMSGAEAEAKIKFDIARNCFYIRDDRKKELNEEEKEIIERTGRLLEKHKEYKEVLEGFQRWSNSLSPSTRYLYFLHIINFLDTVGKSLDELSIEDYRYYVNAQYYLSIYNVESKYNVIRQFAEYLYDSKRNKTNFMERAERPNEVIKRYYDPEIGEKVGISTKEKIVIKDEDLHDYVDEDYDDIIIEEDDDTL